MQEAFEITSPDHLMTGSPDSSSSLPDLDRAMVSSEL